MCPWTIYADLHKQFITYYRVYSFWLVPPEILQNNAFQLYLSQSLLREKQILY